MTNVRTCIQVLNKCMYYHYVGMKLFGVPNILYYVLKFCGNLD